MSVNEKMTAIADAIREKTSGTEQLTLDDMVTEIPKVYESGKKDQEKEFWDSYLSPIDAGSYGGLAYAFAGKSWTLKNFKPNRDLKSVRMNSMFQYNYMGGDLAATLSSLGVKLDTSIATVIASLFHETMFTRLPKLDFAKADTETNNIVIYNNPELVTIDEIVFYEKNTFNTSTIRLCNKLKNLKISGVIAKNGLNLSTCNALSHDSLMSIVNALKDYSTDTSGTTWKVTLGSTNLAKLTTEEQEIARSKGWTLA